MESIGIECIVPILIIIGAFTTLNDLMLTFVCHMMPYNWATYSHFFASCEQLQLFCFNFMEMMQYLVY